jgi:hypothetical protein
MTFLFKVAKSHIPTHAKTFWPSQFLYRFWACFLGWIYPDSYLLRSVSFFDTLITSPSPDPCESTLVSWKVAQTELPSDRALRLSMALSENRYPFPMEIISTSHLPINVQFGGKHIHIIFRQSCMVIIIERGTLNPINRLTIDTYHKFIGHTRIYICHNP